MSEKPIEINQNLYEDYLGEMPDGSQVLVTVWQNGNASVAFREDNWAVWSKPVRCQKVGG